MASKKDLVEAYAYNRRRLVTAFVSGAPGGREVEPSRPGGPIIAGVVLGALVVGAGALAGAIKPSVKDGWDNNTVVVAKKTGARYISQEGTMFPVLNMASARLVIPPDDFRVVFAPENKIAEARQGRRTIGIAGAPDQVPLAADLIQTDWAACTQSPRQLDGRTDPGGMSLQISEEPSAVPVRSQGVVVTAAKKLYVIAGTRSYTATEQAVSALGLADAGVLDVPVEWVNLFNPGGDLAVLRHVGPKTALDAAVTKLPANTVAGDLLVVAGRPAERYVATPQGAYPLNAVQQRLYAAANPVQLPLPPENLTSTPPRSLAGTVDWPVALPERYDTDGGVACVVLEANPRVGATTVLARPIPLGYLPPQPGGVVRVDPGHGSLVSTRTEGPSYLIDSAGVSYELGVNGEQAQLGYGGIRPTFVPPSWIQVLGSGVKIDVNTIKAQAGTTAPAAEAAPAATTTTTTTASRGRLE